MPGKSWITRLCCACVIGAILAPAILSGKGSPADRGRLAEFQSIFGEQATADVAKLSAIVKEKEQTIKSMKLAQQQEAAVGLLQL